jgi:hypothetical protein
MPHTLLQNVIHKIQPTRALVPSKNKCFLLEPNFTSELLYIHTSLNIRSLKVGKMATLHVTNVDIL